MYITVKLVLDYGGGASNGPSSVVITTLEVLQCCSAAGGQCGGGGKQEDGRPRKMTKLKLMSGDVILIPLPLLLGGSGARQCSLELELNLEMGHTPAPALRQHRLDTGHGCWDTCTLQTREHKLPFHYFCIHILLYITEYK